MKTPTRTNDGYSFEGLETLGLSPRQSQALLYIATDHTAGQAAQAMDCSTPNVNQLIQSLHWRLKTHRQGGLITAAFRNGFLRVISLLLASLIGTGATQVADASDVDDQQMRFRNKPRRSQGRRTGRRNREWVWNDEDNSFFVTGKEKEHAPEVYST